VSTQEVTDLIVSNVRDTRRIELVVEARENDLECFLVAGEVRERQDCDVYRLGRGGQSGKREHTDQNEHLEDGPSGHNAQDRGPSRE
jgi:hypothetical protein